MTEQGQVSFFKRYKVEMAIGGTCLLMGYAAARYIRQENQGESMVRQVIDHAIEHHKAVRDEKEEMAKELAERIQMTDQKVSEHQEEVKNSINKMRKENKTRSQEFHDDFDRTFNRLAGGQDKAFKKDSTRQAPVEKEGDGK